MVMVMSSEYVGAKRHNEDDGIVSRSLSYVFSQIEARNNALSAQSSPPPPPDAGGDASTSSTSPAPTPTALEIGTQNTVSDGCKYSVRASYSEIYNEALYDLLCFDQRQLSLRWDPVNGFHAPDLTLIPCATLYEAQEVVSKGLRRRRVGSHALNVESSRSHAILTIHIDATPTSPESPDFGSKRMGKVVFVDLAGSERLKDSQSEGVAMRETANINRSLFMLGKVISALASGAKGAVVPYRESKLTKLLMDSLGGSALALMIACCSPSEQHLEETLSTLNYATRAKNIKNAPAIQMDPQAAALASLRREVKLLRHENAFLREQLALSSASSFGKSLLIGGEGDGSNMQQSMAVQPPSPSRSPLPTGSAVLLGHSLMLPLPSPAQEDLSRRLADAQRLLSTVSIENARLAAENEKLRSGGLQVASDYSGAVDEIEWLKMKLSKLKDKINMKMDAQEDGGGGGHNATHGKEDAGGPKQED